MNFIHSMTILSAKEIGESIGKNVKNNLNYVCKSMLESLNNQHKEVYIKMLNNNDVSNKTLSEFLDVMNADNGNFKMLKDTLEEVFEIYYKDERIITIQDNGEMTFIDKFFNMPKIYQSAFMNYFIKADSSKYSYTKTYNVVIGKDTDCDFYTAYRKQFDGSFIIDSGVTEKDLKTDPLIFTEDEICKLEKQVQGKFSMLIDLAKSEVNYD